MESPYFFFIFLGGFHYQKFFDRKRILRTQYTKTFVLYNRITEGLVLRILYPGIRHIKVHSLINPNYSFILNNWNFFEIGQFRLFQNLIICLLPRKTFWFWMLVPAQK
jgi:hypothetical protein